MPRTVPWHVAGEPVYHNNTDCNAGRMAAVGRAREGSGGKRLCPQCLRRNYAVEVSLHSGQPRLPARHSALLY